MIKSALSHLHHYGSILIFRVYQLLLCQMCLVNGPDLENLVRRKKSIRDFALVLNPNFQSYFQRDKNTIRPTITSTIIANKTRIGIGDSFTFSFFFSILLSLFHFEPKWVQRFSEPGNQPMNHGLTGEGGILFLGDTPSFNLHQAICIGPPHLVQLANDVFNGLLQEFE